MLSHHLLKRLTKGIKTVLLFENHLFFIFTRLSEVFRRMYIVLSVLNIRCIVKKNIFAHAFAYQI